MEKITKNSAIGVMDSGVGGLTVLKQLKQVCHDENYLYFGDTKNLPYGEKSKKELIKIVAEIFDFFETQNVKAVVLACNTTSATAYEELKDKYSFKIYPLIQTLAKCITQKYNFEKIAVLATKATINSHKYKEEFTKNSPNIKVFEQACPLWVPIVEKELLQYDNSAFTGYLDKVLEFEPQKIILGCTHYPFLLDKLSEFAPKELFINPAEMFAEYIKSDLKNTGLKNDTDKPYTRYFASSQPEKFQQTAKLFMDIEKLPELIEF